MSGVSGDARGGGGGGGGGANSALETLSAAATAIASAEARVPPATLPMQKRRWASCWNFYWCFGFHKHSKRIGHAVLVPEPTAPGTEAPAIENSNQAPVMTLPFIAPPSSPSFLQSEATSAALSPTTLLSSKVSANIYAPGDRPPMFTIGPYAHETQPVSPPIFSAFPTEPSTAPYTPPPEPVYMTTPSSPEVPFAKLLESYQLHTGSPVGHLISPSSGISGSGTSSPFPDGEFAPVDVHFLEFRAGEPRKLMNRERLPIQDLGSQKRSSSMTLDAAKLSPFGWESWRGSGSSTPDAAAKLSAHGWESQRGSGSVTPDAVNPSHRGSGSTTPDSVRPNYQDNSLLHFRSTEDAPLANSENLSFQSNGMVADSRVSFEITADDVVRCVVKESETFNRSVSTSMEGTSASREDDNSSEPGGLHVQTIDEKLGKDPMSVFDEGHEHEKRRSVTLGSAKDFNFDNVDRHSDTLDIGSDWPFFPMRHPGVS